MTTPMPVYDRAPSRELQELLLPGGFLAPLIKLAGRQSSGHFHDVHFRRNDEVFVYRGHSAVVQVRRYKRVGGLKVTADEKYRSMSVTENIFGRWAPNETGFEGALFDYLNKVDVSDSFTLKEGDIQQRWSRVTKPWVPFDREAGFSYGNFANDEERKKARMFDHVAEARIELEKCGWGKLPKPGRWLDQLAIDPDGHLVLLELKDASNSGKESEVYFSPFQLLQYVWEWHNALEAVRNGLQAVIDARVAVGLTPPSVPPLSGGIRAAVGFGADLRSAEVKRRHGMVLEIVNRHLPDGVEPIETWACTDTGASLVV